MTAFAQGHTVGQIVPISRRQLLTFELEEDGQRRDLGTDHWIRVYRTAMACRFEVVLRDGDAVHLSAARAALDEADRLEALLTVFRDTSALVRVNRMAGDGAAPAEPELFDLLQLSSLMHAATGGAFDVTSTPLSRCWGFLRREGRLPPPAEIDAARARVGMQHVELDPARRTIHFRRPGIELNLGAIGKGYALDRMAELLRSRGCRQAVLSAGGSSVLAIGGGRPALSGVEGPGWTVDLRSRQVARERIARLRLRDGALATSGAGEQFVDVEGTRYGHVLDPRTGWPASGVISASVVTRDAAVADALSTACLVAGESLAARYCAANPETLVMLTPDGGSERCRVFGSYRGVEVEDV
ncbi:MAG: FAD:protein FMN transferase [Vicinamibacterales bacterium]